MAVPNGVTHTASYVAPTSPHSTENVVGVFPTKPPDIAGNDTALQKVPVHNGPHENSIHVAETKASEMAVTTAATPLGVDSTSGKTTATTSGSSMRATSFQTPGLDPVVSKSSTTSSELLALSPVQKPSDRITPPMKAQLKGEIRTYDSNTTTKLFLQSTAKGTRHGPSGGILNPPVHKVSDNEKPPVTTTTTFITTTTTTTTRATRLPPPPDVTRLSRSSSYVTQPPTNSSTAASGRSIPGPSPMNPAGDGKYNVIRGGGGRGFNPQQRLFWFCFCFACQFENSYGPAFSLTLTPPPPPVSRIPGSVPGPHLFQHLISIGRVRIQFEYLKYTEFFRCLFFSAPWAIQQLQYIMQNSHFL